MPHFGRTMIVLSVAAVATASAQPSDPSRVCEQAAHVAELDHGLPSGLLKAIGQVESGRPDAITGQGRAWPWALNADGIGSWPANREAAVAAVETLQSRGTKSIDIGCFQVNLAYHPGVFPSLADGFDPFTNADYAARFLRSLQRRTGDWTRAVMAYHSSTAGLGEAYWSKVKTVWMPLGTTAEPLFPLAGPEVTVAGLKIWTPARAGGGAMAIRIGGSDRDLPRVIHATAREAATK